MFMDRRSFVVAAAAAALQPVSAAAAPHDPLGVRDDFPIVAEHIYLNSAYIAPVSRAVVAASRAYIEGKSGRPMQVGALMAACDAVRAQFARMVNATPGEIGLLNSTGEGENAIANGVGLMPGDNVVVDDLHYTTEFVLYRALEASRGIELRIVKNRDGAVTASDFEPHIDKRTRIVSVAWVSNQNGFRHDMRPIAGLAHAHGALFYADAVQAVGMIPLDVRAAGVDALCSGSYEMADVGVWGRADFREPRSDRPDSVRPDGGVFGGAHGAQFIITSWLGPPGSSKAAAGHLVQSRSYRQALGTWRRWGLHGLRSTQWGWHSGSMKGW